MTAKFFGGEIQLLRVDNIAKTLKVHEVTIRRYIRNGKLRAQKIGRRYYNGNFSFSPQTLQEIHFGRAHEQ